MNKIIPNLSVDCVIFGFQNNMLSVLLTERTLTGPQDQILFSDYTLQGHHIYIGEKPETAAARVLYDKTGLTNIYLEQFHTFGDTDRLMKTKDQLWLKMKYPEVDKHVVSIAYYSLVNIEKIKSQHQLPESRWFPINELPELGYDHDKIIEVALEKLRQKVKDAPILFEVLPERFTMSQLQKAYEVLMGTVYDRRNFRKKVIQTPYVIALNEKRKTGTKKTPIKFMFSRDVYEITKTERFNFFL